MADLAGVRAKLRRADEHRQAYDDLFESYLATHPYSILFEFDPEIGLAHLPLASSSRSRRSRICADLQRHPRQPALDARLPRLAARAPRRPQAGPADRVSRREAGEGLAASRAASALQGVPEEWAALIEAMQPFHRFDRPDLHPLAILEHVNNLTKHRFLPAAVLTADSVRLPDQRGRRARGRAVREPATSSTGRSPTGERWPASAPSRALQIDGAGRPRTRASACRSGTASSWSGPRSTSSSGCARRLRSSSRRSTEPLAIWRPGGFEDTARCRAGCSSSSAACAPVSPGSRGSPTRPPSSSTSTTPRAGAAYVDDVLLAGGRPARDRGVRRRLRPACAPIDEGFALLALLLAFAGAFGSMTHGAYDLANLVKPPASLAARRPQLDRPARPRHLRADGRRGRDRLDARSCAAARCRGGSPTSASSLPRCSSSSTWAGS